MEHFAPPQPSEADKDDDKDSESFLSPLSEEAKLSFYEQMQALFQTPEQEDDEDEEGEADPKKKSKKRLLDFFRRKKIARSTLEEEADTTPETTKRFPSLLNLGVEQPSNEEPEKTALDNRAENFKWQLPDLEEKPASPDNDTPVPETSPDRPATEARSEEDDQQDELDLSTSPVLPPLSAPLGGDRMPPLPPEGPLDTPPLPELPDEGGSSEALPSPSAVSGNVINNVTHIETHPNNAGPAIVGSVIVDQLSRHRDRKIRKEAQTFKKQVEKQEKAHVQAEAALDKKHQQLQEMIEQQATTQQQEKVAPIEHQPRSQTRPSPEASEKTVIETPPIIDNVESLPPQPSLTPELADANAKVVLEQIEAAAERDVAVEGQFERRHEAKDEPTVASGAQYDFSAPPPPAPSSLASADDVHSLHTRSGPKQHHPPEIITPVRSQAQLKQAAFIGVTTAAVIIAIFILLVWLG